MVATGDRTELGRISVELRLEPRPQGEPAEAEAEVASGLGRAARRSGRPLGHKLSVPRASPTTRGTATVRHVTRPPSDGPILHREARTRLHFVDWQAFIRVAQTSPQPAPRSAPTGLHPLTPSSPPRSRARRWSSGSRPTSTPGSEPGPTTSSRRSSPRTAESRPHSRATSSSRTAVESDAGDPSLRERRQLGQHSVDAHFDSHGQTTLSRPLSAALWGAGHRVPRRMVAVSAVAPARRRGVEHSRRAVCEECPSGRRAASTGPGRATAAPGRRRPRRRESKN